MSTPRFSASTRRVLTNLAVDDEARGALLRLSAGESADDMASGAVEFLSNLRLTRVNSRGATVLDRRGRRFAAIISEGAA